MKLFSEKVEPTFTNSSFNILQVENYSEIFFDVYEIELNKIKYPAEKISSFRGNPVVSVPVVIGEKEQEFPFVLIKGKPSILFNENNIDAPVDDSIEIQDDTEVIFENVDLEHESRIKEETKRELMEHIEIAKQNAQKHAEELKLQKIREANLEIRKKNKLLKESLNTAKQELVNEFVSITKSIKRELIKDADEKYSELEITIDNKIEDLANRLSESIEEDFQNSSKELESNIRSFVKSIHNESVLPELRKSLESIAKDAVSKISGIERNLDKKLDEKVDVSVIQELSSELDALRNTNVELNNNINKGVNKALSRIGNVNNRIDEVSSDVIRQLDEKISSTADNISNYYTEKLKFLEDQTFDINEKSRKYFIDLVRESRDNLISEIRKIQKEAPVELVIETSGKKKTKSLDSIEKDIDKKISDRVSDEVVKLRKYIAVYSSGGGSVAQQFANGGVMNGNLTIVGAISASQYLGLSGGGGGGVSGDYLPLSGGTITGNVTINGDLSANNITSNNYFLSGSTGKLTTSTNVRGWKFPQIGSQSLSAAASPRDIYFKPDGMVAYVLSNTNRRVYSFNLSQAWDITTISVIPSLTSVQVDLNPEGFSFSPDGIYMFVIAQSNRIVSRYTMPLSAAWDISQATLDNTILLNSVLTVPTTLTFKPDGTKMYVFGETNDVLYEYNLSTPWTVSTALSSRFISFPTGTSGIIFNSDGTRLLSINLTTDFISEYTLPIPWSLSGAYFDANMYQTTRQTAPFDESGPTGLYYNDTVNKCFFIGTALTRAIEVTVVPQPAIIGTRPLILSNPTDVNDKVNINSLRITDTTAATNTANGALIVNGGIGCAGALQVSSTINGLQVNSSQFSIVGTGWYFGLTNSTNITTRIYSPSEGIIRLTNNAANNFDRLQFGDITSSFPAIKRNGSGLDIVLADDTGFTDLRVRSLSASTVGIASGTEAAPSLTIGNVGIFNRTSGIMSFKIGTFNILEIFSGQLRTGTQTISFTPTANSGVNADCFISRVGAGAFAFGTSSGGRQAALSARSLNLSGGDIEVTDFTNGVILKSPNGTRFRITVGDDGALTTTTVV